MKKKFYLMLGSILLFSAVLCIVLQWNHEKTIAASTIGMEQQAIFEELSDFPEDIGISLLFQGVEVPFDRQKQIYYLPWNTKVDCVNQTGFSLSVNQLELFWCEDSYWEDLEEAIAQGHEFTFYVSDGSMARKQKIVFTGLPMMKLDTIEVTDEETSFCKVTVYDPFHHENGVYELIGCNGYLRLRGKTSKSFPKKGFNLDLVKASGEAFKTNLFGLREDDDWKLNALYPDATKVREAVCMELWEELAAQTESVHDKGTNMEYFELFSDGDYRGIYGAMEQLDFKQFSLDQSEDVIYKGYAWPLEGNIDKATLHSAADYCGHWIKTGGQPISEELWRPFVEYADAANFMEQQEICDTEAFYEYVQAHMDMDNFLNLELYVQLLYAFDNKYKNLYIATDLQDNGDYTMFRIPWDLNYSFGDRYSVENTALTIYNKEWALEVMPHFMMSETLLAAGNEAFAQSLNEKWEELKKTVFATEHVRETAEYYLNQLTSSGAFERDRNRWPDGPHDTSLEEMLDFHDTRLNYLDQHYQSFLEQP